ncbi:MAG TPA: 16S rRNA (cytosine(967)-C(5))-methyltransferase RsmB [Clostridiaceae bacterium]|nr:16S rRNA (cytosine(967)-C(5))-methyltransferase RsmB [Clostridiaceae bacterium]
MSIDLARETALKVLYDINEKGAYTNISVNKYLSGTQLRDVDRNFITELVYGTVRWKLTIDWIIRQFSNIKLEKLSPWILNIMRLGVYQLLFTDKVPQSAACNESVKLSKKYGHSASSGFVNAVLRNIARNRDKIKYPERAENTVKYFSIKYSHPEWMIQEWIKLFGEEFTESLLQKNNETPLLTVRANTLKTTREELSVILREAGLEVDKGRYAQEALVIRNPASITRIEAFQKGYFQVQDESSMLVGNILDPKPGELVIDVCSAPGGKATHIAQLMKNSGTVIARDVHPHKIKLIDDAAKRLSISCIKTEVFDATKLDERYIMKADRVLVDAPCTGLGIIRRKPDIKWERHETDSAEITKLQRTILDISSEYVKPGGVLVYSTCTIMPEENQDIVYDFINRKKDFELQDITGLLPSGLSKKDSSNGFIQLYPNIDEVDGFFIARIVRRRKSDGK